MPRQGKFIWLSFDRAIRFAAALVSGALVARALAPEQYGQLAQALLLFSVLDAASSLGLPSVIGTRVAVTSVALRTSLLSQAATIRVLAALFFSLTVIMVAVGVGQRLLPLELLLVAAFGVIVSNWMLVDGYFQGCDQPELGAISKCVVSIAFVAVRFWHVEAGSPTAVSLFVIFCLEQMCLTAMMLLALWWLRRRQSPQKGIKTNHELDRRLLRYALTMWAGQLLTLVYMRADQLLLSVLGERESLANYAIASQLAEYSFTLSVIFQAVYVGRIGALRRDSRYADAEVEMRRIYRNGFAASSLLCAFACAAADRLVPAIYGVQYIGAVPLFQILIWTAPLVMLGTLQNLVVFTSDTPQSYLKRVAVAAVLSLPFSFIGFLVYGTLGLAVSSLTVQILACFALNFLFDLSSWKAQIAAISIWKKLK